MRTSNLVFGPSSHIQGVTLALLQAMMLYAQQPRAVQAACRALGALALADPHTKRHLLSTGTAAVLASLLVHSSHVGTPVTQHPSGHQVSSHDRAPGQGKASIHGAESAAFTLQHRALRSSSGEHSVSDTSEGDNTWEPKEYKAAVVAPPMSQAALAQAAAMLEVVLQSTSATAMQQLTMSRDTAKAVGVATGVLGAIVGVTSKVVLPIDCGIHAWRLEATTGAARTVPGDNPNPRGSCAGAYLLT
jgi:hypothetical protein